MTKHRMHSCITLDYMEARTRAGVGLLELNGIPLTERAALATIHEVRNMGYEFWPDCDNVDARGHCAGHETKTSVQQVKS